MSNDTILKLANDKKHHLLVIRLSAMGDVAMTVPVLIALTSTYPQLKLTILTKPFFAPILAEIPNVTVHNAEVKGKHKGILGLWKLYKELKSSKFDGVADLHNVLRSTILKQFFRFQNIPFAQIDKGRKEKKQLTDATNKVFEPLRSTHLRYVKVFEKLGLPITLKKMHVLKSIEIPALTSKKIGLKELPIIGIAPFAAFAGKEYPLSLMQEVLAELNRIDTYQILLFGGGEKEMKQLQKWDSHFKNCVSVVNKLSFKEELILISNLKLMLAMDSGNAHLAAMFGVPTVTLWGVTHPYAGFYPFGQDPSNALLADREKYPLIPTSVYGNKWPTGYENVMTTISPTTVVVKIRELLGIVV